MLLLRTLFWASLVFQDALPRRILSRCLSTATASDAVSLKSAFRDVLRLGIIRKIQKSELGPVQVISAYDTREHSILFTSIKTDAHPATDSPPAADLKLFWQAFEETLNKGAIAAMTWDHAAVAEPLRHPVFRFITFSVGRNSRDNSPYHFVALAHFIRKLRA